MYSGQIRKEVSDNHSFTVKDMVSYVYIINSIFLLHPIFFKLFIFLIFVFCLMVAKSLMNKPLVTATLAPSVDLFLAHVQKVFKPPPVFVALVLVEVCSAAPVLVNPCFHKPRGLSDIPDGSQVLSPCWSFALLCDPT